MPADLEITINTSLLLRPVPRPLPRQMVGYVAFWNPQAQAYLWVVLEVVDA